jgi:hypothetical protein
MSRNKFVSAVKPTDYAEQLFKLQQKLDKMRAEVDELEATEKHLQNYLMRYAKGETFAYVDPKGYEKRVKIRHSSRLILDQAVCKKLLKSRTPYKTSTWSSVNVDYVYVKEAV